MAAQTPLRILYANVIDPNATMSESVAVSGFPADYCANDFIGVRSRISDRSTGYFQATFTSAQSVTCMVVQGHNLTASGTVALKGSNNNWASSTVIVADTDIDAADPRAFYFSTATYTSFRLYPVDSSNPDGYIEMGKWFLGTYVQPSINYQKGWNRSRQGRSVVTRSTNGIEHIDSRPTQRMAQFSFERATAADVAIIEALITSVTDAVPFYVVADYDHYPNEIDRVRFDSLPTMSKVLNTRWSYTLALREAL
jgi:hypothetical protein